MEENHFEKICTIKSNNNVNVSLYRSKLSGMRVAFVEQPTLIVNGRFTLATKATSDDDLPHTLEHLTFEGSQKYPYKGFLNIVANQCFGSDINGSTAQDHTFYSISTVGQEGFLKILPIYLDHLFFPLLSPEQYITKIHHINAEGRDGGVVYAEMQDLENSISTIMNSALHRIVFPEGHPYRANTGGSLPAIRNLCSLERIKAFHKEYYRPSNMMFTIVGNIDVQKVADILSTFEKQYNDFSCKIYPFHDVTVPEYFPFQLEHIKYPAEDESVGRVSVTWQGPPFATPDTFALPYLLLHFISDPETPLQQRFTQIKEPICDNIKCSHHKRPKIEFEFCFIGVNQEYLNDEELFTNVVLGILKESKIDMDRMRTLINKSIERIEIGFEADLTEYYHDALCTYLLYVPEVSFDTDNIPYLELRLNEIDYLKSLLESDESYWKNLARKYFTKHRIIIIGHPDAALIDEISQKENERIKAQIERLGPDGLKQCGEALQNAINKNNASAPTQEILKDFAVDYIDTNLIKVERTLINSTCGNPFPIICHKIDTKFLDVLIMFDLSEIPAQYRSFINLYTSLIFSSNVRIDGDIVSYENVPKMLKKDFISHNIGFTGYEEFLCFSFTLLPEKYSNVEKWMKILSKNVIFDNSRISLVAKSLSSSCKQLKQNGDEIASELSSYLMTPKYSNLISCSMLTFGKFHNEIDEYASENKGNKVVECLNELSEIIINAPTNIHLTGNSDSLNFAAAFKWNISNEVQPTTTFLKGNWKYSVDLSSNRGKTFIIPYGASESGFLRQQCETKFEYLTPENVCAHLFCHYLNQINGPIKTNVRGKGLAYSVSFSLLATCGINFKIYRAADLVKAYEECKNVIHEILTCKTLDENLLKGAKRSMIASLVESVSFPAHAASLSFGEFLCGIPSNENLVKYAIDQVWKATPENIFESVSQCFIDLFDEQKCIRTVVPYQNDFEKIHEYFKDAQTMSVDDFPQESFVFVE